jgi:hypothetical protein
MNEQVIHVNDEPSFSDEVAKKMVHECLERGRGVAESKEHNSWFEETEGSDEHHLPVVFRSDQHIVKSPAYVHFSKDARAPESVDEVRDKGEGVCVFNGVGVDIPVVLAGTYRPIFLRDKEER